MTYEDPNYGEAEIVVSLQQFARMAAGEDLAAERVRVTSVESERRRRRREAAGLTNDQMCEEAAPRLPGGRRDLRQPDAIRTRLAA
ncbi:hypothetical protein [Cryptosporangium arvum]|uniref:Uncharacterized protein n=1 Tax=Cryptosporangium arvum DSM 44712 TaxID=927661 RepID=A0A010ZYL6_9ACTN|nr:hypothetical protein [Cryptosporangium arvum]EXG82272.1 hypothetical protein CryarDRAFT_3437 [Cryptosporangium arvum DSM 44712]